MTRYLPPRDGVRMSQTCKHLYNYLNKLNVRLLMTCGVTFAASLQFVRSARVMPKVQPCHICKIKHKEQCIVKGGLSRCKRCKNSGPKVLINAEYEFKVICVICKIDPVSNARKKDIIGCPMCGHVCSLCTSRIKCKYCKQYTESLSEHQCNNYTKIANSELK